jgi:hypothetical protein
MDAVTLEHLVYLNLAGIIAIAFSSGSLWQRVRDIERKAAAVDTIGVLLAEVASVKLEITRLRDRLDKLLDFPDNIERGR